ncbi:MAG: DUF2818 family protein [Pseudomonadota bacterium]
MASWVVLVLGVVLANIPFVSERLAGVVALGDKKGAWVRLAEWFALFLAFLVLALGIERRVQGTVHTQDWEFYVVIFFLFCVFATPGFIWRYLWLRRGQS